MSATSSADEFTYEPVPTVTSISPIWPDLEAAPR